MFAGLLTFIAVFMTGAETPPSPAVRTMTVEQRLIVRVPIRPRPVPTFHWEEEKGPECFPVAALAGADVGGMCAGVKWKPARHGPVPGL